MGAGRIHCGARDDLRAVAQCQLVGRGRQPVRGVVGGDRRPQRGQPGRVVARVTDQPGQVLTDKVEQRLGQIRTSGLAALVFI